MVIADFAAIEMKKIISCFLAGPQLRLQQGTHTHSASSLWSSSMMAQAIAGLSTGSICICSYEPIEPHEEALQHLP